MFFLDSHPTIKKILGNRVLWLIVGAVLGVVGPPMTSGAIAVFYERATFPMVHSRIEQVRSDITQVPCGVNALAFQSLITEAVVYNLRIAYERKGNTVWYWDPLTTDKWNELQFIALPCGRVGLSE